VLPGEAGRCVNCQGVDCEGTDRLDMDRPATVCRLGELAWCFDDNARFNLSLFQFAHELPLQLRID